MRKPFLFAAVAALTTSLAPFITPRSEPVVLKIVVVGKGIPQTEVPQGHKTETPMPDCKEAKDDEKPGLNMWGGALTAWTDPSVKWPAGVQLELVGMDDADDGGKARDTARQLEAEPEVLAIIGHSISGTTRSAAEIYAQAAIPLIMPLATAQAAVFPVKVRDDQLEKSPARLSNCFRLPPSDDRVQAPAIAYLVEHLQPQVVHIIEDEQGGAKQYASPLCGRIEKLLRAHHVQVDAAQSIVDESTIHGVVEHIADRHGAKDVVIFCGYQEYGNTFLKELSAAFQPHPENGPSLVFSEASPDIQKKDRGFRVYRTGSYDPRTCENFHDKLGELTKSCPDASAEQVFGYDAVLFIHQALEKCGGQISRDCLLRQLRNTPALIGSCFPYFLRDGENVISSYYVFRSQNAPPVPQLELGTQFWATDELPSQVISPSQIIQTAK